MEHQQGTLQLNSPNWIGKSTWGKTQNYLERIGASTRLKPIRRATPIGQSQAVAASNHLMHMKSPPRHNHAPIGKQEKHTTLHRVGHHHVGPVVVVLLQEYPTIRHNGTTESEPLVDCLAVATVKNTMCGASPRSPSDSTSLSLKTLHAGPQHVRHNTKCHRSVY